MNIMQSMTEYADKPQVERDADTQAILAAMRANQAQHDVKYGKSRRVFKDRFVNSNVSGGGL